MRGAALISGLLGGAAGVLAGLALAPRPSSVPAVQGVPEDRASAEVLAELKAIRTLLEARVATSLAEPVAATEPAARLDPAAGDAEPGEARVETLDASALVAALRSLEQAVCAGRSDGAGASRAGLRASEEELATPRTANLGALRTARAAMKGEGQQVLPDLFGLSPAQVYRRFGTPAVVGNSPGRVRWMYRDPDYPGFLVVTFFDGYVGWIHVAAE